MLETVTLTLHKSWIDPIRALPAAAQGAVFTDLLNFGSTGAKPAMPTDATSAMAYGITLGIIAQMAAPAASTPAAPAVTAPVVTSIRQTPEAHAAPAPALAPAVTPAGGSTPAIPTLDQVIAYWQSRGYYGAPKKFYDYYARFAWNALEKYNTTWQQLADRWAAKETSKTHDYASAEYHDTTPTLAEVVAFWREQGLPGDPRKWYAAKAAKGWISRGKPIRDWQKLAIANAAYLHPEKSVTKPVPAAQPTPVPVTPAAVPSADAVPEDVLMVPEDDGDYEYHEIQEVAYDIDDLLADTENVTTGASSDDADDLPY